jgi:hypothetical protein
VNLHVLESDQQPPRWQRAPFEPNPLPEVETFFHEEREPWSADASELNVCRSLVRRVTQHLVIVGPQIQRASTSADVPNSSA